jgi:NADH-quinone oxidoreductase subunit N
MYFKEPTEDFSWVKLTPAFVICLIIAVAGVMIPGVIPGSILELAQKAILM